jgi:hypothetical protein
MSSNIRVNSITPSVGNSVAIGTAAGSVSFNNAAVVDIDGHTELDNVNISGVVTATSFVGPVTGDITGNIIGDVTGNITGVAATFSGNVSIAGTLTYEDVTNIDSVGIVTARDGIIVTGGHIGVGVTPESWSTNLKAVQIGRQACVTGQTNANIVEISANAYHDSGWKYIENDTATSYYQYQRDHVFSSAASGTADAAISFTETLRITGIGSVGISSATPKTDVDISQKTGAVALPQGTTAQRPTGSAPYIRKNTTNNALEYFDGTSWVEIITDYFPTGSTIFG